MGLLNLLLFPVLAALGLFETAPAGGATSGAPGGDAAGGSGTTPTPPAPPATPAAQGGGATGGADQGTPAPASGTKPDAGPAGGVEALRADLAGERDKRQAVERELEQLRNATKTDSEKALDAAKKEGRAEADGQWSGRVIRSEAKSALAAAGATDVGVAVAAFLDEHRSLKVNDEGEVEELAAKVTAFTKAHPTLFTARVPSGSGDGGATPPPPTKPAGSLEEALTRHYQQKH